MVKSVMVATIKNINGFYYQLIYAKITHVYHTQTSHLQPTHLCTHISHLTTLLYPKY
jgi:hypothetical protein